jgi:hypothetical protein
VFKPDPDENKVDAKIEEEQKKEEDLARSRIAQKHAAHGGAGGFLGKAVSDVRIVRNGFSQQFEGGTILVRDANKATAFEVHGPIAAKYFELGGPSGFLGFPTSDERDPFGLEAGRMSTFQGGTIFWRRDAPEAFEVHGAIGRKYALPLARTLGYPGTDETPTSDGVGRFNQFERGHPDIGPHEVHGAIRARYQQLGFERSELGYPTSDEQDMPGGKVSHFEFGRIEFTAQTGAREFFTFSPRRVSVRGEVIANEDDFGPLLTSSIKTANVPVDVVVILDRLKVPVGVVHVRQPVEDEVRIELDLEAQALPGNRVRVNGEARFFEGDSAQTQDLEDRRSIDVIVRNGATESVFLELDNDEALSLDNAFIDLRVSNIDA